MPIEPTAEDGRKAIDTRIAELEAMSDYPHNLSLQMIVTNLRDMRKVLEPKPPQARELFDQFLRNHSAFVNDHTFGAFTNHLAHYGYRIIHESEA